MFDTAVVVGLYHKSDNTIDINPDETKVFSADDQIVALSTSGDSPCHAISVAAMLLLLTTTTLVGILCTVVNKCRVPFSVVACSILKGWLQTGPDSLGLCFPPGFSAVKLCLQPAF